MPNLLVHYGSTLIGGSALRARRLTVALLLGATWPDVPWVVLRVADVVLPQNIRLAASFFVQPFASPFMCLWAGAIFACVVRPGPDRRRQTLAFTGAAWFHLLLDAGLTRYGNGVPLLYPVSLRLYNFEWFREESTFGWAALLVSAGVLGWAIRRGAESVPWARPPWTLVAPLAVGYLAMPCITWQQGYADNTFGMAFVYAPTSFEGREVGFERNLLVSTSPPILRTWYGRELPLRGATAPAKSGDVISVRGIYRAGTLEIEALQIHQPYMHTAPSALALLALMVVLWRARRARRTSVAMLRPPPARREP